MYVCFPYPISDGFLIFFLFSLLQSQFSNLTLSREVLKYMIKPFYLKLKSILFPESTLKSMDIFVCRSQFEVRVWSNSVLFLFPFTEGGWPLAHTCGLILTFMKL